MTNQFNPAVPVDEHRLSHQAAGASSDHTAVAKQRLKAFGIAMCLSIVSALGVGVTGYYITNQAVTKQIAQTQRDETSVSPTVQTHLLLALTLATSVTALLASAIWALHQRFANASVVLGKNSPISPGEKTLLFGEIASQAQSADRDYLYRRAVDGAQKILGADRVMIYTFDANWHGTITAESVAPGVAKSLGNQIVDTCMRDTKGGLYRNGRVCVINNVEQAGLSDCHLKLLENYQVKANMVVPILKDDQLLGLMIAHQCDSPRVWQPDEIDFFVQLASLIALRLSEHNFLQQRAKAGQLTSFSQVTLRIRQSLDPEQIFNTAVTEIQRALNVERVLICRLDSNLQDGDIVTESVISDCPKMLGLKLAALGIAQTHLEMFKNGYAHPINHLLQQAELNQTNSVLAARYQVKASLVAPIRTSDRLQGLIIAHQCSTMRPWEQPTIDLFEDLATQVGLALEQATLLKSVANEAMRTQFLADFTARIRQSLNSQNIFSTPLEEIRTILETDRVLIYRFNPGGKSGEITSQSVAPSWTPAQAQKMNQLVQAENFQDYKTGSLWVAHDVDEDNLSPSHSKLLKRLEIKASMVAPILAGGQLVGLLCAHQCSSCRNWQQSEFYFLQQLAVQIGFALEQASLVEQVKIVSQQQQQQTEELQRQLFNLIGDVEGAAKGDLTVRAEVSEGEIGTVADFFNAVIESLRRIVTQVKLATTQVNTSLLNNEEAILQLSSNALKQAQETTRTLDSLEQMTRSIQHVASRAHHAAAVARDASETAQVGTQAMERTAQKISSLRDTVAEAANKVRRLGESSQQISKVVSLINQIALQTNLLAMNAGIEAARAGEESQSFAVVAKEVGELAARSAEATQEIEQIVETIQAETAQVVETMKLGTTQVAEGTQLVEDTKQSLSQILGVSRQIDQLVASISTATVSQVKTSYAVTELMKDIARVSEETSKSSHQISSSLQETVDIAQQLQASVEVFKVEEANSQEPPELM
jgi:methyl-accepting chemotaxis protein PixJ